MNIMQNGGSTEKGYYTSIRYRTFKDLMSRNINYSLNIDYNL